MTMKANELMIGDYVNVTGKEGLHSVDILELLPRIGKVIGLDEEIVYVDYIDYAFSLGDVEPIPLTDDILKASGFEKRKSGGVHFNEYLLLDDYFDVGIYEFNDGMWCFEYECTEMSGIPYSRMNVGYVHELQHALRLCGIEKEIIIKKED